MSTIYHLILMTLYLLNLPLGNPYLLYSIHHFTFFKVFRSWFELQWNVDPKYDTFTQCSAAPCLCSEERSGTTCRSQVDRRLKKLMNPCNKSYVLIFRPSNRRFHLQPVSVPERGSAARLCHKRVFTKQQRSSCWQGQQWVICRYIISSNISAEVKWMQYLIQLQLCNM